MPRISLLKGTIKIGSSGTITEDCYLYSYFSSKQFQETVIEGTGSSVEWISQSIINAVNEVLSDDTYWYIIPFRIYNASKSGYIASYFAEVTKKIFPNSFTTPTQSPQSLSYFIYNEIETPLPVRGNGLSRFVPESTNYLFTPMFLYNNNDDNTRGSKLDIRIPILPDSYYQNGKLVLPTDTVTLPILKIYVTGTRLPDEITGYRVSIIFEDFNFAENSEWYNFFTGLDLDSVGNEDDPYDPGGGSEIGGGGGNFDNTSVPIDFPSLPSISVASTGFVTLYSPTLSQLNELASYMWSDLFDIDGWKKLFADPMDAILGLSIVPVNVPTSGASEVKVGNISTGVALNKASTQYVEVDCGAINVNEYWGAYLDYSPYTKCEIFLPYVGIRPLSIDDVMNKEVHVKYHVDILSGGLTCFVKCGESVLYSFIGQCSCSIPINSANYTNMLNGVLSIAGSIGSTVATGGMMAPATAATVTTTAFNMMKPEIQKSGAMSGAGAMLGMQIPYLILTRPRQALPTNQNKFSGYPSLITLKLSELSGYTEIEKIHLENIPATEVELTELEKLLMEGVIF